MTGPVSTTANPDVPTNEKPLLKVDLTWTGDLVFAARSHDAQMTLDSAGLEGPSPMQALACALAGCMAMDLVHILTKGRVAPSGVRASLSGRRPATAPSRFTAIALHFDVEGPVPEEQIERAIQLSRDKYCSVWNSMRQDIELTVTYTLNPYQPQEPTPQD